MADIDLDRRSFEPVMGPPERAQSLPPWCYTAHAFFEVESVRAFRSAWASVGRAERVAAILRTRVGKRSENRPWR